MNSDKFDKELSTLYQQRKSQVIEPKIDFEPQPKRAKYSPFKLLSIFLLGGTASFGIMAIISHLTPPPSKTIATHQNYATELLPAVTIKQEKPSIKTIKPLPPKPEIQSPSIPRPATATLEEKPLTLDVALATEVKVEVMSLPTMTQPLKVLKPTYKVMPKYKVNDAQAGLVDLSYHIAKNGSITDIKIINSNVNRALQRSAKRALAKWQYQDNLSQTQEQQVRFKFLAAPIKGETH